ncbi:hypothetical protein GPECTOR_59g608 [Gonium pectorale]|uniref:Uncharacterized protein n=1 Tax=Gonium pectorale TaxID=33097 RepID=A0A150G5A3_GONPE|nr:hypothetical protein GPECTOR_59g608 [Gonium pectorale]|eukprot:KXZ45001.1 hypothetical protein GPECTOR_59g608 [Gonium pectorale]
MQVIAQRVLFLSQHDADAHPAFLANSLGATGRAGPTMRLLPIPQPAEQQQQQQPSQPHLQHHVDDGHLWAAPNLMYLPWDSPTPPAGAASDALPAGASPAPPPPLPRLPDLPLLLEPRLAALAALWHSAVSLQQRLLDQHDDWVSRQRSELHEPRQSPSLHPRPGPEAETTQAAATGPALSARWYRSVFAPEMRACASQLACEAPGPRASGGPARGREQAGERAVLAAQEADVEAEEMRALALPDDAAAVGPPGGFDLRDLYRLIRVLEVAAEDLQGHC